MIELLESQTPAVRLASKSWLAVSTTHFRRILDPILSIQLSEDTYAEKGINNELYFTQEYDSRFVIGSFSMLRSMILNSQSELISYLINEKISIPIQDMFK